MSVLYCLMKFGRFGTFIIETYDTHSTAEQAFSSAVIKNALLFLGYHMKLRKRYLFTVLLQETHIRTQRAIKNSSGDVQIQEDICLYVWNGT